jgi:predicted glycosyltransferase
VDAGRGRPTALFYCHDSFGLGHLRRTLGLVEALRTRRPDVTPLVATGSPLAHAFRLPDRVDYLKLPAVAKVGAGRYDARSLALPFAEIAALRCELLLTTVSHVRPSLVVVDNVPGGLARELVPALRELQRRGETRFVLGLRDVVDEPGRVRREWTRSGAYALLDDVYDRILVYGQQDVFDVAAEYGFSGAARAKTRFVGYVRRAASPSAPRCGAGPFVLVTAGGGEDGFPLLRAAIQSRQLRRSRGTCLVVTGPFLPAHERNVLIRLARGSPDIEVVDFVSDLPGLIARADAVVSMGGYNSVCEILSAGRPAVIVPRIEPRLEQLLRARALERRGFARVVHPDDLTPESIAEHVDALLSEGSAGRPHLDLTGFERAAAELDELLSGSSAPAMRAAP